MTDYCYNSLIIKDTFEVLKPIFDVLTLNIVEEDDDGEDTWIGAVCELLAIEVDNDISSPVGSIVSLVGEGEDAELRVEFETAWYGVRDFVSTLPPFKLVEYFTEEMAVMEYAEQLTITNGVIGRDRSAENCWYLDDSDAYVVCWDSGKYTLEGKALSERKALTLIAKECERRASIASHPKLPLDLLLSMLSDEDEDVSSAAREAFSERPKADLLAAVDMPGVDLTGVPRSWLIQVLNTM